MKLGRPFSLGLGGTSLIFANLAVHDVGHGIDGRKQAWCCLLTSGRAAWNRYSHLRDYFVGFRSDRCAGELQFGISTALQVPVHTDELLVDVLFGLGVQLDVPGEDTQVHDYNLLSKCHWLGDDRRLRRQCFLSTLVLYSLKGRPSSAWIWG